MAVVMTEMRAPVRVAGLIGCLLGAATGDSSAGAALVPLVSLIALVSLSLLTKVFGCSFSVDSVWLSGGVSFLRL